jgi:Tfp pilus assembly protein FimT
MKLTFDQLVDELEDRPSEELAEFAALARQYAIERRRKEIAENARLSSEEWQSGKLTASDSIGELMKFLHEEE